MTLRGQRETPATGTHGDVHCDQQRHGNVERQRQHGMVVDARCPSTVGLSASPVGMGGCINAAEGKRATRSTPAGRCKPRVMMRASCACLSI